MKTIHYRLGRESAQRCAKERSSVFLSIRGHLRLAWVLIVLSGTAGCRSRVIQITLVNTSPQPVSRIIVDYPGASFGKNVLGPGDTFRYVIKPVATGPLKIQFSNAQGANYSSAGPALHKDQEGSVEIKLDQVSASIHPSLK